MPGFVRSPGRTRGVAFFDDDRTQAILVAHLDLAGFGRRFGGAVNGLGSSARTLAVVHLIVKLINQIRLTV